MGVGVCEGFNGVVDVCLTNIYSHDTPIFLLTLFPTHTHSPILFIPPLFSFFLPPLLLTVLYVTPPLSMASVPPWVAFYVSHLVLGVCRGKIPPHS